MEFAIGYLIFLFLGLVWYSWQCTVRINDLRESRRQLREKYDQLYSYAYRLQEGAKTKQVTADTNIHWKVVLGFSKETKLTKEMVDKKYKRLAMVHHPDLGGTSYGMKLLNLAKEKADKEL